MASIFGTKQNGTIAGITSTTSQETLSIGSTLSQFSSSVSTPALICENSTVSGNSTVGGNLTVSNVGNINYITSTEIAAQEITGDEVFSKTLTVRTEPLGISNVQGQTKIQGTSLLFETLDGSKVSAISWNPSASPINYTFSNGVNSVGDIRSSGDVYAYTTYKLLRENLLATLTKFHRYTFSLSFSSGGVKYHGTTGQIKWDAAWECIKLGFEYTHRVNIDKKYAGWNTMIKSTDYPYASIVSTSFFNVDYNSSSTQYVGWQAALYVDSTYPATTETAANTGANEWIICPNIPDDSESQNDIIIDIVVCFSYYASGTWTGEPLLPIPVNNLKYYTQKKPYFLS